MAGYDIKLVWDPIKSEDLDRYEIYRAPNIPIIGVNQGSKTFTIDTIITSWFQIGDEIQINGSTGNDNPNPPPATLQTYTVNSVTELNGTTIIGVNEAIPSPVANGYLGTSLIAQLAGKTTSSTNYIDKELPAGFYYYIVVAVLKNGDYNSSDIVIKTAPEDSIPPPAVENLRATTSVTYDTVQLTWNEIANKDIKGYAIYRTVTPYGLALRAQAMGDDGNQQIYVYGNVENIIEIGDKIKCVDPGDPIGPPIIPPGPNNEEEKTVTAITYFPEYFLTQMTLDSYFTSRLNSSGYFIWEHQKWELVETTSGLSFSDTKIPKGIDWFSRITYTQYRIHTYDSNYNLSTATYTEIFEISPLDNKRVTIDYLDLNIYWDKPRDSDHIQGVVALIKEKNSTHNWVAMVACRADEVMTILNSEYTISKGKSYDVMLATRHYFDHSFLTQTLGTINISPITEGDISDYQIGGEVFLFDNTDITNNGIYSIINATGTTGTRTLNLLPLPQFVTEITQYTVILYGNYAKYYRGSPDGILPGDTIYISSILFTGQKVVEYAENINDYTIIYVTVPFATGEQGDLNPSGLCYSQRPRAATTAGSIIPISPITITPSIPGLTGITIQPPSIPINIPDYIEDTIKPRAPTGLTITKDPVNDRAYLTWDREEINDDFLRYEIYIFEENDPYRNIIGGYHLHGKTTDNNYTINGVKSHIDLNSYKIFAFSTAPPGQIRIVGETTWQEGDIIEARGCTLSLNNNVTYLLTKYLDYSAGIESWEIDRLPAAPGNESYAYASRCRQFNVAIKAIDRAGNNSDITYLDSEWRSYEYFGKLDAIKEAHFDINKPPFFDYFTSTLLQVDYWLPGTIWWAWTNKYQYGRRFQSQLNEVSTATTGWLIHGRHGPYMDNVTTIPTKLSIYAELRLRLTDMARSAEFFDSYIILGQYGPENQPDTHAMFKTVPRWCGEAKFDNEEVLEITNTNEITINLELPVRTGGTPDIALYIWVWVRDKFGNVFPAKDTTIKEIRLPANIEWS